MLKVEKVNCGLVMVWYTFSVLKPAKLRLTLFYPGFRAFEINITPASSILSVDQGGNGN